MAEWMRNPVKLAILLAVVLTVCTPVFASRRVTDELGRSLVVPDEPHRIICLSPSLTETVYELGLGDAVAGVTEYTSFPPEARTKPSVGGLVNPSMETIVSLQPDLVLALRQINGENVVQQLEHLAIPVFIVDPQGLDGVLASIQHVGDATNRSSEAQALVKRLKEKRDVVTATVNRLPRPKALVVIWYEPVITAGNKAFITDVISAAGGESVTSDISQAWPQISMEEVSRRSPDFLLLIKGLHGGITLELLKGQQGWDHVEAVRHEHVIYVDERMELPSPLVFDALEELARELHPSAFARSELAR